jgi:hypothetical protein
LVSMYRRGTSGGGNVSSAEMYTKGVGEGVVEGREARRVRRTVIAGRWLQMRLVTYQHDESSPTPSILLTITHPNPDS